MFGKKGTVVRSFLVVVANLAIMGGAFAADSHSNKASAHKSSIAALVEADSHDRARKDVTGSTGSLAASGVIASYRLASHAKTGRASTVPYGWVDFCGRQPQECSQGNREARDIVMTQKVWGLINRVNKDVNQTIEPISNLDHWGTLLDHWDYPSDGKGDCKIYALEKRRQLMRMGVPRQALLMTIVKDHEGAGHTILTLATDQGDFILDNLSDEIVPWSDTGYRFLKRQSQEDPNLWLTIEAAATAPSAS